MCCCGRSAAARKRQVELTVAILQLVASAAASRSAAWSVAPYLDRLRAGQADRRKGLRCALFGATTAHLAESAYIQEFIELSRRGAAFAA